MNILREGKQTLIFTNWLEAGIKILTRILKQNNITYLIVQGETPPKDRLGIVEKFNKGEVQVLLITLAGAEGLDLKAVRNIIIIDPVWSQAVLEQIAGRGVRYLSHADLPLEERHVDIYQLMTKSGFKALPSGDELLYKFIDKKKAEQVEVYEMLQNASI
jgi:SNF2 family DNA or RNA helicase